MRAELASGQMEHLNYVFHSMIHKVIPLSVFLCCPITVNNIFYNTCTETLSLCCVWCNACLLVYLQCLKDVVHAGDVPPIHFSSSDSGTNGFPWLCPLAISELSLAWLPPPHPKKTANVRCFWFILHSKISIAAPETLVNLAFSDFDCLSTDSA